MPPSPLLKEETLFGRAEAEIVEQTLKKYGGNRAKTAQALGIDRTTLWRKMKKYGFFESPGRKD
jgi:DNA-binding NtrC family response regulator